MTVAAALPTQITAHHSCLIAADTSILGPVTLGEKVFVHPKASIQALRGPIEIGAGCLIEENVTIVNRSERTMRIASGNVFMVGGHIEATEVGDRNTFQPGSRVRPGIKVSSDCIVGTGVHLHPLVPGTDEVLEPYTIVHGDTAERRKWNGAGEQAERLLNEKHLEYIREILPKSTKMRTL